MRSSRGCSRNGCDQPAVATLTYIYAESTAVLGPLAATSEPHTYDLCQGHARSLTAPRGWDLVRYEGDPPPPPTDDLLALADAVFNPADPPRAPTRTNRGVAARKPRPSPHPSGARAPDSRRGHLRAIPPPDRPGG